MSREEVYNVKRCQEEQNYDLDGGFLVPTTHGDDVATTYGQGFSVEAVSGADGVYKIRIEDTDIVAINFVSGSVDVGVSSPSVANLTAARSNDIRVGCRYTSVNTRDIYIDTYDGTTLTPTHFAGSVVSFTLTYKTVH